MHVWTPNGFIIFDRILFCTSVMNVPGPDAFAQGREEIWLWPSAVAGYYFTLHDSFLGSILFLMSIPAGAIFYTLHATLRDIVDEQKQINRRKSQHSRSSKTDPSKIAIDSWGEAIDSLLPSRPAAQVIIVVGMIIEILLIILSFLWLFKRIVTSYPPTITEVGLISLPVLSVTIIGAKLLWKY